MNSKIKSVHARQIVDCKCRPMVEVDVVTEDGFMADRFLCWILVQRLRMIW